MTISQIQLVFSSLIPHRIFSSDAYLGIKSVRRKRLNHLRDRLLSLSIWQKATHLLRTTPTETQSPALIRRLYIVYRWYFLTRDALTDWWLTKSCPTIAWTLRRDKYVILRITLALAWLWDLPSLTVRSRSPAEFCFQPRHRCFQSKLVTWWDLRQFGLSHLLILIL